MQCQASFFAYICVRGSVWLKCRVHYVRTCVRFIVRYPQWVHYVSTIQKVDYIVLFVQGIHVGTVSSNGLIRCMNIYVNNMISMIDVCYQYLLLVLGPYHFLVAGDIVCGLGLLVACTIDMGCWVWIFLIHECTLYTKYVSSFWGTEENGNQSYVSKIGA